MLKPIPIDDEHIERVKLRAAHKLGEHEHVWVEDCPECQAEAEALRTRGR